MKPPPSRNEHFERQGQQTPVFCRCFLLPLFGENIQVVFPQLRSSACRSSLKVRSSLRKTSIEASRGFFLDFTKKTPHLPSGMTPNIAMAGISPFFSRKYIDSIRVHFLASYVSLLESKTIYPSDHKARAQRWLSDLLGW